MTDTLLIRAWNTANPTPARKQVMWEKIEMAAQAAESNLGALETASASHTQISQQNFGKARPAPRRNLWWPVLAAAACAALALGALWNSRSKPTVSIPPEPSLPKLSVDWQRGNTGFECYSVLYVEQLENGNPWQKMELTTLPVYKPTIRQVPSIGGYHFQGGLNGAEMEALARQVAARFGCVVERIQHYPDEAEKQRFKEMGKDGYPLPYLAVAECGECYVRVQGDGSWQIYWQNGLPLPPEYKPSVGQGADPALAVRTQAYLQSSYGNKFPFANPAGALFGDYRHVFDEQQMPKGYARQWTYIFYDRQGDPKEQFLQYQFKTVQFSVQEDGRLWAIQFREASRAQPLGEYPILTPEEAEAQLLAGRFLTTAPEKVVAKNAVRKVELCYRTGGFEAQYMPWYRFYVELPDSASPTGLRAFGAYYVPAVRPEYLDKEAVPSQLRFN